MKILFAASEGMPFVKTGGLADVIGALPKEIIKKGADIRVILPLYKAIDSGYRARMEHVLYFYINLGWRRQYVGIEKLVHDGVTFYFVDNEQYFGRDYIYGHGGDEGERFAYFCKAVLEALPKIDFMPDVIHCHDWQTGLIPALYTAQYKNLPLYQGIKTVFTIHNIQYQGTYGMDIIGDVVGLKPEDAGILEYDGDANFMKGGIECADRVTTVSPSYAQEILDPWYSHGLDPILRERQWKLCGVCRIRFQQVSCGLLLLGFIPDGLHESPLSSGVHGSLADARKR